MSYKTILLTGASRGIGYEMSQLLASQGHIVICVARSAEKLKELYQRYPEQIITFTADLSNSKDISGLIVKLQDRFRHIDLVIHNAGAIIVKSFEKLTDEDWEYQMDVNLFSAVRLFRGILPMLKKGSHLLAVSSMGGFQGSMKYPGLSAYSVTKGALAILTECLAIEFSDKGVAINCLCLGAVQTEMLEQAFPGFKAPVSASEMAGYIAEFGLSAHHFYNGKILPVALSDPG